MFTRRQTQQSKQRLDRNPGTQWQIHLEWFSHGPSRKFLHFAILIGSALTLSAFAGPPAANVGQLQQLNRASETDLRNIQRPSASSPGIMNQTKRQKSLHRAQRAELQRLQERQRRELLLSKHRAKTIPSPGPAHSWRQIDTLNRFQRQQQYQLNRFRLQR